MNTTIKNFFLHTQFNWKIENSTFFLASCKDSLCAIHTTYKMMMLLYLYTLSSIQLFNNILVIHINIPPGSNIYTYPCFFSVFKKRSARFAWGRKKIDVETFFKCFTFDVVISFVKRLLYYKENGGYFDEVIFEREWNENKCVSHHTHK